MTSNYRRATTQRTCNSFAHRRQLTTSHESTAETAAAILLLLMLMLMLLLMTMIMMAMMVSNYAHQPP